jgi:hypothetical protein
MSVTGGLAMIAGHCAGCWHTTFVLTLQPEAFVK